MYQNISLHNKHQGYLHNKRSEELMKEMAALTDLAPEEVPDQSQAGSFSKLTSQSCQNII
jgi:hypothetical protein